MRKLILITLIFFASIHIATAIDGGESWTRDLYTFEGVEGEVLLVKQPQTGSAIQELHCPQRFQIQASVDRLPKGTRMLIGFINGDGGPTVSGIAPFLLNESKPITDRERDLTMYPPQGWVSNKTSSPHIFFFINPAQLFGDKETGSYSHGTNTGIGNWNYDTTTQEESLMLNRTEKHIFELSPVDMTALAYAGKQDITIDGLPYTFEFATFDHPPWKWSKPASFKIARTSWTRGKFKHVFISISEEACFDVDFEFFKFFLQGQKLQ